MWIRYNPTGKYYESVNELTDVGTRIDLSGQFSGTDVVFGRIGSGVTPAAASYLQVKTGTNLDFSVRKGSDFGAGFSGVALDSINDISTVRNMMTLAGDPVVLTGGNVGIGTSGPGHFVDIVKDQNAISTARVSNQNSGASAYAQFGLGAYGNSWGARVGSYAANTNRFELVSDLSAPTVRASLDTLGNFSSAHQSSSAPYFCKCYNSGQWTVNGGAWRTVYWDSDYNDDRDMHTAGATHVIYTPIAGYYWVCVNVLYYNNGGALGASRTLTQINHSTIGAVARAGSYGNHVTYDITWCHNASALVYSGAGAYFYVDVLQESGTNQIQLYGSGYSWFTVWRLG